jgi:putative flippase GtrA
MLNFIKRLFKRHCETIAYLFCGFFTVLVNTASYLTLALVLQDIVANTIAFFIAMIFAYWTNSSFVFKQKVSWETFVQFFCMRIGTIIIDNGLLWILLTLRCNNLIAKSIVNIIIIILNYIFSKFFIFKVKEEK